MSLNTASKGLKQYLHPHYVVNFILSVCYFVLKLTPGVCEHIFTDCILEMKEYEMLMFFGCIMMIKNRRATNISGFISVIFMFSKVLSSVMFFRQNLSYFLLYGFLCLLHLAFLPEPVYSGPENVTMFRSESFTSEVLNGDRRVTWLIEMYAAWSPTCVTMAPIFAEISNEFGLSNLKFGKIDVSRYQVIADQFKIDTSGWSRNLPSVILFEGGKETMRRPFTDNRGKILKCHWSKENVIRDFQLASIYEECKKNPLPKKQKTS